MDRFKGIALVLLVAGTLALLYGGFTYTKETHEANLKQFLSSRSGNSGL